MKNLNQHLVESSMARVYQHTQDRNIGIISAERGDLTSAENNARHSQLKSDLRKAGYGFVRLKGRYIENYGKDNARPVDEKSLLVIGKKGNDNGQLLGHLKKFGEKYGQDSVLHKPFDSKNASLHGTNDTGYPGRGKSEDVGEWHPNRASEFQSILKGRTKPKAGKTARNADQSFSFSEEYVFVNEVTFFSRKEALF